MGYGALSGRSPTYKTSPACRSGINLTMFCHFSNSYEVKLADKPGSVVDSHSSRRFVTWRSSNLPAGDASNVMASLFGLAPDGVYRAVRVATNAVSSYLAVSPLPDPDRNQFIGGLFSVALSIASRRPVVNRHPALRSPDFPLRNPRCAATV